MKKLLTPGDLIKKAVQKQLGTISYRKIEGYLRDKKLNSLNKDTISKILNNNLDAKLESFLYLGESFGIRTEDIIYPYLIQKYKLRIEKLIDYVRGTEYKNLRERLGSLLKIVENKKVDIRDNVIVSIEEYSFNSFNSIFVFPHLLETFDISFDLLKSAPYNNNIFCIYENDTSENFINKCREDYNNWQKIVKSKDSNLEFRAFHLIENDFKHSVLDENSRIKLFLKELLDDSLEYRINDMVTMQYKQPESPTLPDFIKFLKNFIIDKNGDVLVIEGSMGMGKTTSIMSVINELCTSSITDLNDNFSDNKTIYLPFFAPYRRWKNPGYDRNRLVNFIFSKILKGYTHNPDYNSLDLFNCLPSNYKLVVFVDGIDEGVRSGDELDCLIEEVNELLDYDIKVVISTRPEVFEEFNSVEKYFANYNLQRVLLQELDKKDVCNYLSKFFHGDDTKEDIYLNKLDDEFAKIVQYPLFLFIVTSMGEGIFNNLLDDPLHETYALLEKLFERWESRERNRAIYRGERVFDKDNINDFMWELAAELSYTSKDSINERYLPYHIMNVIDLLNIDYIKKGDEEITEIQRELTVNSFINVSLKSYQSNTYEYSFNVRAFSQFILVRKIVKLLNSARVEIITNYLGRVVLTKGEIYFFKSAFKYGIINKNAAIKKLIEVIKLTKSSEFCRHWKHRFLGGNSLSLLAILCDNKLNVQLNGVSLCGAYLNQCKIQGTINNCDLSESIITNCGLSELKLLRTYLKGTIIKNGLDEFNADGEIYDFENDTFSISNGVKELDGYKLIKSGKLKSKFVSSINTTIHSFYIKEKNVIKKDFDLFWVSLDKGKKDALKKKILGSTFFHRFYSEIKDDETVRGCGFEMIKAYVSQRNGRVPTLFEYEFAKINHPDLFEKDSNKELVGDYFWIDKEIGIQYMGNKNLNPYYRPFYMESPAESSLVNNIKKVIVVDDQDELHEYLISNIDMDIKFRVALDVHVGLTELSNTKPLVVVHYE